MLSTPPPLLFLLLLQLPFPALAAGGVSVFQQNADILPLAVSLTILVALTVTFELAIHNFRHYVESWHVGKEGVLRVIDKVNAELTVLGFISVIVLITANSLAGHPVMALYLPEFEVAHLWLFFVGMVYVVEAFVFLWTASRAKRFFTRGDRVSNAELVFEEDGTTFKTERARKCHIFCSCPGKNYEFARHKIYRVLFKHFHRDEIRRRLEGGKKGNFDFAAYLSEFWEHMTLALLHIPIFSWAFFLVVFWIVVAARYASQLDQNKTLMPVALTLNQVVSISFLVLQIEQEWSLDRVNKYVALKITGKPGADLEDAFEALYRCSNDKETFDDDGALWEQDSSTGLARGDDAGVGVEHESAEAQPAAANLPVSLNGVELVEREGEVEDTASSSNVEENNDDDGEDADINQNIHDSKIILAANFQEIRNRVAGITRRELLAQTFVNIHAKRVVFSGLVFLHAFMCGWFFFLNLREISNSTLYFGRLPPSANASASSSSSSSSSSSVSGSHRMLLSSSASSSASGSGPSVVSDGYHTCQQFKDAGSPLFKGTLDIDADAENTFMFLDAHRAHIESSCSIVQGWYGALVVVLTFVPLFATTFYMIPAWLGGYAYQKAIIGSAWDAKQHNDRMNADESSSPGKVHGVDEATSSSGHNFSAEGHSVNEDDHQDDHADHGHGHADHGGHHGSWCTNTVFGHDDTTFDTLIQLACDTVIEEYNAKQQTRDTIVEALMRPVNPRIASSPHEPITMMHLMHASGEVKSTPEALALEEAEALKEEEAMSSLEDVCKSRAKTFFAFLHKLMDKYRLGSVGVDVDHAMLKWGIRQLSNLRLDSRRPLTKATEYHLGRALDKDGTGGVSEAELLLLVVPPATGPARSGTKASRPSMARYFKEQAEKEGHGESKHHDVEEDDTQDLFHRSKEELVAMLLDVQRQLAEASVPALVDQHRVGEDESHESNNSSNT